MNRIEFVLVLLFTFFVIVVWITSDVVLARPQTAEDPKVQKLPSMLEALSPNFDAKTIEQINNLKIAPPKPRVTSTPPPTPEPVPSSSPQAARRASPSPSATPVASSSSADLLFGSDTATANNPIVSAPPLPSISP